MNTHVSSPAAVSARSFTGRSSPATKAVFVALLAAGVAYSAYSLRADVTSAGPVTTSPRGCPGRAAASLIAHPRTG